jgi:hypothetical protein
MLGLLLAKQWSNLKSLGLTAADGRDFGMALGLCAACPQ